MRRFPRLTVGIAVGGLLLGLLLVGYWGLSRGQASQLEVFGAAPAFALTDQFERPLRSDDFAGQVVVANFIYTRCPDVCPLLSRQMQGLQDRLRQEQLLGSEVQLLSFTVDPARDTPHVLREYADKHQADPAAWRFLTGSEDVVIPLIVQGFHLGVDAIPSREAPEHDHGADVESQPGYEVMHSGRFVLIDREWRIRAYYDGREFQADDVIADIRAVERHTGTLTGEQLMEKVAGLLGSSRAANRSKGPVS